MRLSVISLTALIVTVCNAAPVYWELPLEDREVLAPLEVRDDGFPELFARMDPPQQGPYPGPGMRHRQESNPPVTNFHPAARGTYYQTPHNVYSANQVNRAAGDMLRRVNSAPTYNSRAASRLRSYPKPSTGFRPHEPQNPAPNNGQNVAYHAPIGGPRQYTIGPHGSARVGPDRVVAHRRASEPAHNIGVSFHDPRNPIPPARPGGLQSSNHPFSMAQPQRGGPVKVATEKFKTNAKNLFSKFKPKKN